MASPKLSDLIRSDLDRFRQTYQLRGQSYSPRRVFWESVLFKSGFQALLLHRIGHRLSERGWVYLPWFLARVSLALTGAEIEFNAIIGPGMLIAHSSGIVIGRGTVIGSGVTVFQGVTLGVKSWQPGSIGQFPVVGDGCHLFAGAAILGGVRIGADCVVGAHAVVTTDMPDGALAVGVPAKIYPAKGRETLASWAASDH